MFRVVGWLLKRKMSLFSTFDLFFLENPDQKDISKKCLTDVQQVTGHKNWLGFRALNKRGLCPDALDIHSCMLCIAYCTRVCSNP